MRRVTAALVALVAAATFVPGATAEPGSGTVAGSAAFADDGSRLTIGAHGGPLDASGVIVLRTGGAPLVARVDCVVIVENTARVAGTLAEPVNGDTQLIVEVVDNGPDGDLAIYGTASLPFNPCSGTLEVNLAFPVEHGNFVVNPD